MKKYVIIAGANGAGKSTFYATAEDDFESIEKVNFDEIVRSIGNWTNASDRVKAGRVVVEKIDKMFSEGCSFSQETTLCGKSIRNNIHNIV